MASSFFVFSFISFWYSYDADVITLPVVPKISNYLHFLNFFLFAVLMVWYFVSKSLIWYSALSNWQFIPSLYSLFQILYSSFMTFYSFCIFFQVVEVSAKFFEHTYNHFLSLPKNIFSLLLERDGREREMEGEEKKDVREKHWLVAFSHAPQLDIKPAVWVCVLTKNQTCDILVHR